MVEPFDAIIVFFTFVHSNQTITVWSVRTNLVFQIKHEVILEDDL